MSIKKTVAIAAAAGALTAVAMPALALENEVHGSYTFNSVFSNFAKGDGSNVAPQTLNDKKKMNNYFEQRARLQYIAKASDELKLVTQFELDTRFGGITDNKYTSSNDAGGLDADGISLETKHVYIDFNLAKNFNTKIGIQPYKDTIKGLFIDADLPMVLTNTKFGSYTLGLGYSRYSEAEQKAVTNMRLGDAATDLFVLDNTFALGKDAKAALSYYFLADYKVADKASLLHTLGLSGETKVGSATLSAFAAMQTGHANNAVAAGKSAYYHGWAANVGAKMPLGSGTAKTAFLFTSGDKKAGDSGNGSWVSPLNSYNESGMMILARNTANSPSNTDDYIRRNVTNIALLTLGYDANLTNKVYLNGNAGLGWTPASGEVAKNASDFMGAEFNLESGYKVSDNLTLRAQAAYMFLGGLYKDASANSATKNPENPYTMRLLASFKF